MKRIVLTVRTNWRESSPARRAAVVVIAAIVALAIFGPFLTRTPPSGTVGAPFASATLQHPLGTDFLGRDVLSRVLYGGRTVLLLATSATLLAYAVGIPVGLIAGSTHSIADPVLMRSVDVFLAFPPILFLLLLAAAFGPSVGMLVIAIAVIFVPGVARIVRSATQDVAGRGYVEAAIARGERTSYVLGRELLPNIRPTLTADLGLRVAFAILLVASVNYLGLGLRPPTPDWALMISENRAGITLQPWSVLVPALLIATLTVAISLSFDRGAVRTVRGLR